MLFRQTRENATRSVNASLVFSTLALALAFTALGLALALVLTP
jgi:biopolymer transport protein ExbB/TolQ